jgi:hypothetical protein
MISRRVKVLVSTRNHPSMSVAGTRRHFAALRGMIAMGA